MFDFICARRLALLLFIGGALAISQVSAIGQQNPIQVENARTGTIDWPVIESCRR